MQQICPACNGILVLEIDCPNCGYTMTDLGAIKDYFGPYSPYEEISLEALEEKPDCSDPNKCIHVVECLNCAYHSCKLVDRVNI